MKISLRLYNNKRKNTKKYTDEISHGQKVTPILITYIGDFIKIDEEFVFFRGYGEEVDG